MKAIFFPLFLLIIILPCCQTKELLENKIVAEKIIDEVQGSSGQFFFTEDKMPKNEKERFFIELNVDSSELLKRNGEKVMIASYCASQLYKRLDKDVINKNYGINITFNKEIDLINDKLYFFNKTELKNAWNAFDNIDKYINSLLNNVNIDKFSMVDTNFVRFDLDSINQSIKKKIGVSIVSIRYFYSYYYLTNKTEDKTTRCFHILAGVTKSDSSEVALYFLSPMYEANNKIIYFNLQD